jgi:Flp pilus assembly protein TadG
MAFIYLIIKKIERSNLILDNYNHRVRNLFQSFSKRLSYLKSHIIKFNKNESGSLSLLIIGLFIAALSALMVVTDVAVVANAKRTLDQATEAAAMKAVQNLDQSAYYSSKHTILTSTFATIGASDSIENRIPVDCNKGWQEVSDEMSTWMNSVSNMKTLQIENYEITMYDCVYDVVHLETKARVKLPFPAPFSQLNNTTIYSSSTTLIEKDKGLWLFGWRLH